MSPTNNLYSDNKAGRFAKHRIEMQLNRVLWEICNRRTIAIVSTKDFNFLHDRTRFANVISCMMSIETLILEHIKSDKCYKNRCVRKSILNTNVEILKNNSKKLESIIDTVSSKFKDLIIYRKLTFKRNLLAGITIDWRNLDDWHSIKKKIERNVLTVSNEINGSSEYPLFVQTYSSHPFVYIFSTSCSKGMAYDNIYKIIQNSNDDKSKIKNILYLGDSENDNPAFRKADLSIGVKSDERLNPKLDCQFLINFSQLPIFLMNLLKNDFNFCEKLLE